MQVSHPACSFLAYARTALPRPDNTGGIQAQTQPMVFPGLSAWSKPQAPGIGNRVCIMSRRQLVKTSAQCTILLRYCQYPGSELADNWPQARLGRL